MTHPNEFNIISSTSDTPTLKINCIASMLEKVRTENIVMVIILLGPLNGRDVKKPKNIKKSMFDILSLSVLLNPSGLNMYHRTAHHNPFLCSLSTNWLIISK